MLDESERRKPSLSLIREISDTSSSPLRFVQARRRFIEEEKLRGASRWRGAMPTRCSSPKESFSVGRCALGRRTDPLEHLGCPALSLAPPEANTDGCDLDVLGDRQAAKQTNILERPRQSALRQPIGRPYRHRLFAERDPIRS